MIMEVFEDKKENALKGYINEVLNMGGTGNVRLTHLGMIFG